MVGVQWVVLYDFAAHFMLFQQVVAYVCYVVSYSGMGLASLKQREGEKPKVRKVTCTTVSLRID